MSIALLPIGALMLILLVFILISVPKSTKYYMAKKIAIILFFILVFVVLWYLMPVKPIE